MTVCACGRSTNDGRSICDRCTALVVFGLTRDATQAEIKDAYRVLAKVWHPDRFQGDERLRLKAEEKLKEINSAYQLLITTPAEDPHRRPSSPPPPPQEPRQTGTADTTQIPHARPITNNFAYAFRLKRRAARIRVALTVLVLLVGAAWVVQRYGRTIAYELDLPYPGATSTMARKTDAASAKPTVGSTPASSGSSATNNSKSAHTRITAAASEGPSLLVYPADDPGVPYFTIGSTRSDVVKVQGTPTRIAGNTFEYGLSQVYFQNGRVQSWHADPSSPLKARMPE
jgi:DnaJ domain